MKIVNKYLGYRKAHITNVDRVISGIVLIVYGLCWLFMAYLFSGIFGNFMGDPDATQPVAALLLTVISIFSIYLGYRSFKSIKTVRK